MVDYIVEFPYIKPSLHLRDEAYLIMFNGRFDGFLDSVYKDFVEYFCINVVSEVGLNFSFFVGSLCDLGMRVILASRT